jgi:hypothetical protein
MATILLELWIVRRWTAAKGIFAGLLALVLTAIFALGLWQAFTLTRPVPARIQQWVQAIRGR